MSFARKRREIVFYSPFLSGLPTNSPIMCLKMQIGAYWNKKVNKEFSSNLAEVLRNSSEAFQ